MGRISGSWRQRVTFLVGGVAIVGGLVVGPGPIASAALPRAARRR